MGKSIFFCDIEGTYRTSQNEITNQRKFLLQKFANILDNLCEETRDDELYFSFISSNPVEEVIKCIKEFLPYVKNSKHIKMGVSYSDTYKIVGDNISKIIKHETIGKPLQIVKSIEILKSTYNQVIDKNGSSHHEINRVYFADDTISQHKLLTFVFPKKHKMIQLIDFIPGDEKIEQSYGVSKKGLDGLIESINQYVGAHKIINSYTIEIDKTNNTSSLEK